MDDKNDRPREKLRPYVGKRIRFRGTLGDFKDWRENYHEVGRACLVQPEIDGEVVCHHVWVLNVLHWERRKEDMGKQVEFDAVVRSYKKGEGETDYSLTNPGELHFLHEAPAVKIPEPRAEEHPPATEMTVAATATATPKPDADPLDTLRQVKAFAKAVGGLEQAEQAAAALEDVTLPAGELLRWLRVLREE
jgi:hypothetical protein